MTNRSRDIQNPFIVKMGLSHFLTMTATLLRSHLPKLGPQITKYRNYKNSLMHKFSRDQRMRETSKHPWTSLPNILYQMLYLLCQIFAKLPSTKRLLWNENMPEPIKLFLRSVILRHMSGSYYEYCEWNYELLQDITRYYEWYYEILRGTTRYHKWYCKILRGITIGLGYYGWFLESSQGVNDTN